MTTHIGLRDILINARQESFRMQHYFLGVEHLFIALLEIQGGLASSILEEHGLTARYVIDAIRRHAGKGSQQRLWAGMPNSPRADVVLGIANDLALEDGRAEINERDLLIAILDEHDSIPVRILRKLDLDIDHLLKDVSERTPNYLPRQPHLRTTYAEMFDGAAPLSDAQLLILRRMFYGYDQIRIEQRLTGGYTEAAILVVTPINADNLEDASVVVKIDHADIILDEAQRYDLHVKNSLPPLTARLEERPTTAETSDLAGLKYTFIGDSNSTAPNLRIAAKDLGVNALGDWLHEELYPYFGRTWWQQRRPFRFQVWSEYDWLLPPVLTLEYLPDAEPPGDSYLIKDPVRRERLKLAEYGDVVVIENFVVQRVHRDKDAIQLAIGKGTEVARRAYKIEVIGMNLAQNAYYRGEVVDQLIGRVWKTRSEQLFHAASALDPDFDLQEELIPGIPGIDKLPNPIFAHEKLLDRYVNGSLSKIHGDLHLGNILMGPNRSAFLIDFANTRNGHTLFDWASLEISLLSDVVMAVTDGSWDSARQVAHYMLTIDDEDKSAADADARLLTALDSVIAVREIAFDCLARPNHWSEYHIALALCSMRAITWDTMPRAGRRLMFLLAALAIKLSTTLGGRSSSMDTVEDSDLTDLADTGRPPL
ncbi:MAG: phosphotransferase [Chloroflexi bacterium]|nr:phosphotransferase [Chloroflexota bacterium]